MQDGQRWVRPFCTLENTFLKLKKGKGCHHSQSKYGLIKWIVYLKLLKCKNKLVYDVGKNYSQASKSAPKPQSAGEISVYMSRVKRASNPNNQWHSQGFVSFCLQATLFVVFPLKSEVPGACLYIKRSIWLQNSRESREESLCLITCATLSDQIDEEYKCIWLL